MSDMIYVLMFLCQARKALCALRGLVNLQALVRGHWGRKQAKATLRCMQALVTAQVRARAQRIQMGSEGNPNQKHRNATEDNLFRHIYNVSFMTFVNLLIECQKHMEA